MSLDEFRVALSRNAHAWFYQLDWRAAIDLMSKEASNGDLAARFLTQWVTHGAKIRAAVADDRKLAAALRNWLPAYSGSSLNLFRGESADRFDSGRVGFCWTPRRDVAEMFAAGLNAPRPGGGVLLQAVIPATAVISGPGAHSLHLDENEYTVDPSMLGTPRVLDRYPPADRRPN